MSSNWLNYLDELVEKTCHDLLIISFFTVAARMLLTF